MAGILQPLLQRVKNFGAHAHGVAQSFCAHRHNHELLEVDRIVGMRPAIDDVHHGNGQNMRVNAADIAVQRKAGRLSGSLGGRQRNAENRVRSQSALVGAAVELDHRLVDLQLVLGVHAADCIEDLAVDGVDGLLDALAKITLAAIAQLDRLVRAGGGARRHCSAAKSTVLKMHIDFNRRIAAAVENLTPDNVDNGRHCCLSAMIWISRMSLSDAGRNATAATLQLFASASNAIRRSIKAGSLSSGTMLGPSDGAWSGS